MRSTLFVGMVAALACASALPHSVDAPVIDDGDQPVRIALTTSGEDVRISGTGSWRIYNKSSTNLVTRGENNEVMRVQMRRGGLVAVKSGGSSTSRYSGPFLVRSPTPGSFVMFEGKRYRGELIISAGDRKSVV